MFAAAYLDNTAPTSAIGMHSPYHILHYTELNLGLVRVIGAGIFVHIVLQTSRIQGGGRTTAAVQI